MQALIWLLQVKCVARVADLGDVAGRVWEVFEGEQPRWLLVIDNADDPGCWAPKTGRAGSAGLGTG